MTEQSTFKAISDPTRRNIIGLLAQQEMTVSQVSSHFAMSRPAVIKHLAILRDGGLISVEQKGREKINRLQASGLKTIEDWLSHYSHFWDGKLNKLKQAVEKQT